MGQIPYKCTGCERAHRPGEVWCVVIVRLPIRVAPDGEQAEVQRYACEYHCLQKVLREVAALIAMVRNEMR